MTVRRTLACLVSLALGLVASFAVACGGGDEDSRRLLGENRAAAMREDLQRISRFVEEGRCDAARDRLDSLRAKVQDLPRRTDPDLRDRLAEGVAHLEEISPTECRENDDDTKTTETTETVPETTPETVPETTPETVPETTPQTTPPTQTTPPPTQTPPPEPPPDQQPPPDSGGEEAPLGDADALPPGQAKKGGKKG